MNIPKQHETLSVSKQAKRIAAKEKANPKARPIVTTMTQHVDEPCPSLHLSRKKYSA
jgi:hypothetical protein